MQVALCQKSQFNIFLILIFQIQGTKTHPNLQPRTRQNHPKICIGVQSRTQHSLILNNLTRTRGSKMNALIPPSVQHLPIVFTRTSSISKVVESTTISHNNLPVKNIRYKFYCKVTICTNS